MTTQAKNSPFTKDNEMLSLAASRHSANTSSFPLFDIKNSVQCKMSIKKHEILSLNLMLYPT